MIVVAWRQREQNTFASTFACAQAGRFATGQRRQG